MIGFYLYRNVHVEVRNLNLHLSVKFSAKEGLKRQLHEPYAGFSAQILWVDFTGNQCGLIFYFSSLHSLEMSFYVSCRQRFLAFRLYMWFNLTILDSLLPFHFAKLAALEAIIKKTKKWDKVSSINPWYITRT